MDVLGRRIDEARSLLEEASAEYEVVMTKPTRDFFKLDDNELYVIRQRLGDNGKILLTAAAKQRKEV